ncbi:Glycosyltransferase involved in cell wall bisynthesis [Micromonospora pattaloongensis]|uniref:Glycosyltransferase involved in cell wall bisynthesis n=1 Tax=Micromonospora pattaloongensis TaxID=405436 RepID=A0A1H3SL69_9ACTN|nr:glycosyltransferase family 2 protein [Micromonospora pattaloongensis]SDZ38325.1 Glycosyltransferase involved in cell wall bisynthesis [Micromonospora pattaloongensis]
MSGPWASIVVPVYNTARWLPEALASVDRQSCRDRLEVVVIDDGSTDDSGRIAREYAERAPGVRYVRQENAGLGAARNHGVRLASGRYLGFLDSDDVYPPEGLHDLLRLAAAHGAPIAVGDMRGLPPRPDPPWRRELITGQRVIGSVAEAPDLVGNPSACNKVFRRDFVVDAGAAFTEGTAFEDVLFTLPLLLRSPRTVLTPGLAYLYRTRGDGSSIMDARSQPVQIFQHLALLERLAADVAAADAGIRYAVHRWIAYMQLHYAWRAASALGDEQLAEFTGRMSALFKDIPVEIVAEFVSNAGAGVRAAAIYEQDVGALRRPRFSGPLRVRAGHVYAGHPHFDRYRELLRVHDLAATIARIRADGVVEGDVALPGVVAPPGEVRHDILLEVGDGLVRRPVLVCAVDGGRLRWRCEIPLEAVEQGRHRLRLVVRDDGREQAIPARTRGARPVPVGGGRSAWLRPSGPEPELVIAGTRLDAALQRSRWAARAAGRRARASARTGRAAIARALRRLAPAVAGRAVQPATRSTRRR